MKKRNVCIAGFVLLLIVLVGLLPVFLSSGWVQNLLLDRVNSRFPGTLSIGRCSIGWQDGLQCSRVSYVDTKQGIQLDVPELSNSQGLLALIVAPSNLGTVRVDGSVLILPGLSPAAPEQLLPAAEQITPPVNTPPDQGKTVADSADTIPLWDKLNVKLLAGKTTVKVVHGKAPAETLIYNGSLDARLAAGSVHFELGLESGDGEGTATASGFVNLPARKKSFLETLVAEINLHVMDLQLEHFLAQIPTRASFPRGRGELSSELLIKATGTSNLQLSGTNMLRNVQLAGGFLDKDQLDFKQVNLDLDMLRDDDKGWQLPRMQLASDFGTVELTGTADGSEISINGKGKFVLPVLFGQLPHLLKVQPGTSLEDGSMDIILSMTRDEKRLDLVAAVLVEDIKGVQKGHPFAWESHMNLNLDAGIAGGEPQVRKLTFKAPFLNLEGSGDLKTFSLQGTADLNRAVQEVGKLFQLNWDAGGIVQLNAESKEVSENRYIVDGRMDITDFSLSHKGESVVPEHLFTLSGRLTTPRQFPDNRSDAMNLDFELSSWPGKMTGQLDTVYLKGERLSANYQLESDLQLGRLSDLLHNADLLTPETSLSGTLNLHAAGYTEERRFMVRQFDARGHDLTLQRQDTIFQDSAVHLFTTDPMAGDNVAKAVRALELAESKTAFFARGGGYNVFDTLNRRIVLRDLGLTADLGSMNISRVMVGDWQQLPSTLSLQVEGKTDLDRLTKVLQQNGLLTSVQTVDGNGTFAVELAEQEDGRHAGVVNVDISQAAVSLDDTVLFEDEQLHFKTSLQGNLLSGDIDFDSIRLKFIPLNLQARGQLQRSGENPNFTLVGEAVPDFSSLAALLNTLYATDIRAVGQQPEAFSLYYPLTLPADEKYRKMQFAGALHGQYISWSGIDFRTISMPVSLEQGVLQVALTGGVNSGGLKLSPRIDYNLVPPQFTLPEAEQVLSDVQLKKPLVDGVLKRIHPVLGLLARPTGAISARMDRFSWPLVAGGARQADFSTVFNLSKVELVPKGILREILEMAALGDEPMTLKQSEITCNGADGRIRCTPLKILVAESEMTLAGSVGFDGSLDYLLEVPVTRKLVGREGYRVLEGTTLKVPIRGSSEKAIFDPDGLSEAISDLLGQAAGKAVGKVLEEQVDKILPGLFDGLMGN